MEDAVEALDELGALAALPFLAGIDAVPVPDLFASPFLPIGDALRARRARRVVRG